MEGASYASIFHVAGPPTGKYEDYFEGVRDRSSVISDLIEQIIIVEEVITRHREAGSEGLILSQ